ncbi:hypothetical protein PVT68_11705 [Microbulbifer bruguierae]|uniref:Uncharacterized protein n=1 Tax=Microbulbifer bruguierae TaxID=3029061 RepID=A0ABY8N9E4_9GAMM|nr:hypothetical protein [Microbulbifer bruguierae]WGL15433.1 hypothetical protein PVT68_11705 [Microbulbifer bruguierae]
MRALILTVILWCFAVQSLALAIAPACDPGADSHGDHAAMMADGAAHSVSDTHAGDHHSMSCCDETDEDSAAELCQLTCAVGGCGAAVPLAQEWQDTALTATALFQSISPSPLAASQRNLLRPPIGA